MRLPIEAVFSKFDARADTYLGFSHLAAMEQRFTLFIGTFTTLLAVINPLEALPVFLKLVSSHDQTTQHKIARRSCVYATILMVFFLLFGTAVLQLFGVPLDMVRIVGGIVLMKIGFSLFLPTQNDPLTGGKVSEDDVADIAFVPLAMPIMFGPGAMATVIGMSASTKAEFLAGTLISIFAAIVLTMLVTYLALRYAEKVQRWIGPKGIDAVTRIVGFFVASMGMGMIFHGAISALSGQLSIHAGK